MADAAVDSLLDNLKQLLIHHGKLIEDARRQVEQLEENVSFFKSFLNKVSKSKQRKNETVKVIIHDIYNVVYDAEDTINAFITQAAENKTKNYFDNHFNAFTGIIHVADQIQTTCHRICQIYGSTDKSGLTNLPATDADDEEPLMMQPPSLRKHNVVGLKDEAETIVGYLNAKTDYLDVISIIGMPGIGKTTLTGKIFHDPKVTYEFPTRIWVYVSQEFSPKEVFLAILRQMNNKINEDEYSKKNASQLAEEISLYLEGEKFLLVLDDVWEPTDIWDRLKPALPKRNTAGKIMITSRQAAVGKYTNRFREPHNLRYLNQEESVELLQWEVFGKPEFPPELDGAGREIARNCYGLPLAIVVIGELLNTKISASSTEWEKVSESVTTFLEPSNRMNSVISMSYEKLPYHLKECFLYFGMFPEDLEIPVWNLIQMWIAEGLIQPKNDLSMEEIAEYYLDELIKRNLVMVVKLRADGRVKTCRIHDMLRDFCKIESGNYRKFFLQEIRQSSNGVFEPLVTQGEKHRRLCIHSNILDFLRTSPKGILVRSFVTFSEDLDIPAENISDIYEGFKLLRVLEAKPLKFSKIPRDFYHLVHLKYLALSLKFDYNLEAAILPQAFSKLWNIETLIVNTTFRKLEIRADIMQMTRLRHLKTDACATLVNPGTEIREGERRLQTLSTVSPESCTEAVLDRACNLKKLSIRGKIAQFLDGEIGSFECLRKLSNLEKLKLLNDLFPKPAYDGKLEGLPPAYKFPEQLRSLTLFNTFLDWSHMSVLGSLEKLQALKLKDNAFVGMRWEVTEYSFISLEVLHVGRTNLSIWEASAHNFPRLRRLQLHNCDKLEEIPTDLANITALKHMDLLCCQRAAASATKIAEMKNDRLFHLTVFPPTQ